MTSKFRLVSLFGGILLCASILLRPALAVEKFKVSSNGAGQQIWFEAEDFDERSKNENYKLGKKENAVKPLAGAFGDIVTNTGGQGWLLYKFDISRAGGKAGKWRLSYRQVNPSNHSDWLWVLGDDGDKIPDKPPAFVRPTHILGEINVPPPFKWIMVGDGFAANEKDKDAATVNKLKKGENVMMIWTRQSSLQVQFDTFCWSSDLKYEPTDDDYKNAKDKTLAVEPARKLTTIWADLKR